MGAAKPCLGYPSRTAAVEALRRQRVPDRVIAERIGIPVSTVAALGCDARRSARSALRVWINGDLADAIREEAAARRRTPEKLVTDLVAAALADDMIDAILDED